MVKGGKKERLAPLMIDEAVLEKTCSTHSYMYEGSEMVIFPMDLRQCQLMMVNIIPIKLTKQS